VRLPEDPHVKDLALLFPSLPEEQRESVRKFLDKYCEVALKVFERIEKERNGRIDPADNSR
jgi:AMMECR1 domain-containing protein